MDYQQLLKDAQNGASVSSLYDTLMAQYNDKIGKTKAASEQNTQKPANEAVTNPNLGGVNVTIDPQREQAIKDMYNANLNAQKTAMEEAGAQALSDAQANRDKIAGIYNEQKNAASADWERQRRNFLESANTSGINTGAGSQAQLAMMGSSQRTQSALGASQAQAEAAADKNIADISRQTQASINEAIAKNDYQTAAALLDEYKAEYDRQSQRAAALAQYGDFSGFAAIYGAEQAKQMFYGWAAQNPKLAFSTGSITKDQYNNLISGKPINDGLDEYGVRIPGASTLGLDSWLNGGGSGFNMADNLRAELNSMNNRIQNSPDVPNEEKAAAQASYEKQMAEANRF